MTRSKTSSDHPGPYIREAVLPAGLSVTAAAKKLGVGRPALSNMLNGKAALSPEMATRIEKAFGASSDALLKMQTDYERSLAREKEAAIAVRAYTPSFMNIKASQIEAWSERQEARAELAAFVRRLVISTGDRLSKADFPAFENSQRKGWDGMVVSDAATPWIPIGESGWEFGTNRDPARKAEKVFADRTKGINTEEQKGISFVFVTPRNWPGKETWATTKRSLGEWKDVRAYDASDLEQWLEVSIPTQVWMAERLSTDTINVQSLDANWNRWAEVTNPPLSKVLLRSATIAYVSKLTQWLEKPADEPLTVVADSADEALAALSCLFESDQVRKRHAAERVIVVKSAEALTKVTKASANLIIVLVSADAERESAGIHRHHHTIIVTRRNAVEGEPGIFIDLVDDETFREGLEAMGQDSDSIDRLARESGYSLTVLRRRLSHFPAIRTPSWAAHQDIADPLIPLVFVGAWNSSSKADQAVLADITARTHDDIERIVVELAAQEQSPVWSIDKFRGVISKVDALYAVQPYVTPTHLNRFFQVARVVLSENDPALELPENQRWAANLYGKSRRHSDVLRQGLCETLVLLSVHGNNLFKLRLGFDVEGRVNQLISELMMPLDPLTWRSQQYDLPRYAEAAPEVFLDILEQDLRSADPKVHALMQPVEPSGFSSPGRTGLLWALEVLAWNPKWLPRVVLILGKLAELKITDNWSNRPDNSLASIFRSWMPQTAATLEERIGALELLIDRNPDVGWRICIDQFDPRSTIGDHTVRPRWRKDAIGFGQPVDPDRYKMADRALQLSIAWPKHNAQTLGDIVERLNGIAPQEHKKVWSIIEEWIATGPDDQSKAALRERIRKSTMTRRSRVRGIERKQRIRAKAVYDALVPSDVIARHHWLFAKHWVEESADELAEGDSDLAKRDERISKLRENALSEIWSGLGFAGVTRLCQLSEAPIVIGWHLAAGVFDKETALEFFAAALANNDEDSRQAMDSCLSGLLSRIDEDARSNILSGMVEKHLKGEAPKTAALRLLVCAPFGRETWSFVDHLSAADKRQYWKDVSPGRFLHENAEEVNRVVDELLDVDRPRTAFKVVEMGFAKVKSSRLVRLLFEAATNSSEPKDHYLLERYSISEAFKELTTRTDVLPDELARLEFLYIRALDHTEHGIRNLERQLSKSPELFVQLLALAYRRADGGQDPPELCPNNVDRAQALANSAYNLLHRAKQIPGTGEDGDIDARKLHDWVINVRKLSSEYARGSIAETAVGKLLGRGPKGKDGIWPHETVREVLEDIGTAELARGMSIGRYNIRGLVSRGAGGEKERAIAETYISWSKQLLSKYPFTAQLLDEMARMYEHDADRHDTDAKVRKRLHN